MRTPMLAIARRVLRQLRRDKRTMVLLLAMPSILMSLLAWIYSGTQMFDRIAPALFALIPFTVMFLVTSVTTLRERTSGTLERTLSMPVHRIDFIGGYTIAFAVVSLVQTTISGVVVLGLLGLDISGSLALFFLISLVDALIGCALGLLASAFARTEFQAVQFMPAVIFPQFMLCGLLVARDALPRALQLLSDALPLTYAVDAMQRITLAQLPPALVSSGSTGADFTILGAFFMGSIVLAALSMKRQTA